MDHEKKSYRDEYYYGLQNLFGLVLSLHKQLDTISSRENKDALTKSEEQLQT